MNLPFLYSCLQTKEKGNVNSIYPSESAHRVFVWRVGDNCVTSLWPLCRRVLLNIWGLGQKLFSCFVSWQGTTERELSRCKCLQQEEELFYFLQHKLNITVDIGKVSGTDSTSCSVSGRLGQWILSFWGVLRLPTVILSQTWGDLGPPNTDTDCIQPTDF